MLLFLIIVAVFGVLMLIALPISFSLILAATAGILYISTINMMIVPQQVIVGVDNYLLLRLEKIKPRHETFFSLHL